jgi:hypothetical protein
MLLKLSSTLWKPHNYQKKAAKFLLTHGAGALFLDPGLGKTSIVLAAVKILKKKNLINKVLLIAPLRVCHSVWPNEIMKWKDFQGLRYVILHGPHKDEVLKEEADVYIINPDGLEWLLKPTKIKTKSGKFKILLDVRRFKNLGFDTLVIDELTSFKDWTTHRFKMMRLVVHTFSRKWGLTGSPAAAGLLYLFGQCFMLDQGNALGKYITHYQNEFFDRGYDGFTWELKPGADLKIYERLKPLALRMGDELIDMPKLVHNNIKIEMPKNLHEAYKGMKDDLIAKIHNGTVTAANAAVASGKCRQIANGAIYLDYDIEALVKLPTADRPWQLLHDNKLDALELLIEELQGNPLLVAYDFRHDLERFQARFGDDVPYIGGGTPIKRSNELQDAWNAGELPVLFGQSKSISRGLNLQGFGNHVCWFSLPWSFEVFDQLIRRVRRQGNKHARVFSHHLIVEGTIDELILGVLQSRKNTQDDFFAALKSKQ